MIWRPPHEKTWRSPGCRSVCGAQAMTPMAQEPRQRRVLVFPETALFASLLRSRSARTFSGIAKIAMGSAVRRGRAEPPTARFFNPLMFAIVRLGAHENLLRSDHSGSRQASALRQLSAT